MWAQRLFTLLVAGLLFVAPAKAQESDLTVFAASSLTDLSEALVAQYRKSNHSEIAVVTGSSSTLARQIESGAPADIFLSANKDWADYVTQKRGYADPVPLFGNALVVISQNEFAEAPAFTDLPELVGVGRLAIGDPDHVPAGIYAKAALEAAGIWSQLQDHLVPAADVRSALGYVTQGAADYGIVYATDAIGVVPVVTKIDPALYPPIIYYAVTPKEPNVAQSGFLDFLKSEAGQKAALDLGFTALPQ